MTCAIRGQALSNSYAYFEFTTMASRRRTATWSPSIRRAELHRLRRVQRRAQVPEGASRTTDKGKPDLVKQAKDGWLALVQHYFVSAWLAPKAVAREYVMEKRQDGTLCGQASWCR